VASTAIPLLDSESAAYIMGRTEQERKRLLLQSSILNPLTESFLRAAGLSRGMRVLDLGCGIGDVSLIAAHITGPTGEVTGIDLDEKALELARERSQNGEYFRLTFERADLTEYNADQPYDAVVGRHVLLHTPDPLNVVRRAASLLRNGGLAAFIEYDLSVWPLGYPHTELAGNLSAALVELFRRVTPHPNIGMQLAYLLQQAGFSNPRISAECLMEGDPQSHFYEWFAETVRSVLPAMQKFGLAEAAGDPDTLAQRLRDEIVAARGCVTSPLIVSASARRP
jgi:ubiquinone/menaquinone biosynthesis C-methylase UbiE